MDENKYLLQYTDRQLDDMQSDGTLQPPTAEELKEEAIRHMRLFGYYTEAIKRFEREGVILKSEGGRMGLLYELDEQEQEIVRDFEEQNGGKVYACIKSTFKMVWGEIVSMLTCMYVPKYYSEWRTGRADLTEPIDDKGNYHVLAYVANLTDPMMNEAGYVCIAHTAGGGYQRTA